MQEQKKNKRYVSNLYKSISRWIQKTSRTLLLRYHDKIAKIAVLPKRRRIGIGVFLMLFGLANLLNPFLNGIVFIVGGIQVLFAKRKSLPKMTRLKTKQTLSLIKKHVFMNKLKKRRLSRLARTYKKRAQHYLQKLFSMKKK